MKKLLTLALCALCAGTLATVHADYAQMDEGIDQGSDAVSNDDLESLFNEMARSENEQEAAPEEVEVIEEEEIIPVPEATEAPAVAE